jgi:hypothetical protein
MGPCRALRKIQAFGPKVLFSETEAVLRVPESPLITKLLYTSNVSMLRPGVNSILRLIGLLANSNRI